MADWLSSTWEANWRSFQYFNLYRLVMAGLLILALLLPRGWMAGLDLTPDQGLTLLAIVYMAAILSGLLLSIHWQHRFNMQLSIQVLLDAGVVSLFMYAAGGIGSGLGVLLLVSLAAASLVGRGRLVLFYAAIATLSVLAGQLHGIYFKGFEPSSIVQAGILSAGFFATAVLARLLGQRVMANEDLARRRGIALENQNRISQRVVERMQDGMLVAAVDGTILRHNPVAVDMLGLPAICPFPLSGDAPELWVALAGWRAGVGNESLRLLAPDGRELHARFEMTSSSDGEALIFLEDVERIKEHAQQLKLASLGRLTASIAHEIRNPLSAISHAGELLREERRGEIQDRLLRIVSDNVFRLDRIVNDVLELGRQNRADPELIHLEEFFVNFAEDAFAATGEDPGILSFEIAPASTLCFDRSHLHQVLWNLVGNALRHCSRGAGAVCLQAHSSELDGRVELHVIDDGPGVPEQAREQIFEPFFTTHSLGTGLGLFIARELCASNGAVLELAAETGRGHFVIFGRNDTCH